MWWQHGWIAEDGQLEMIQMLRCNSERKSPQQELNLPHHKDDHIQRVGAGYVHLFQCGIIKHYAHRGLNSQIFQNVGLDRPLLVFEWFEIYTPTKCNPELNDFYPEFFLDGRAHL